MRFRLRPRKSLRSTPRGALQPRGRGSYDSTYFRLVMSGQLTACWHGIRYSGNTSHINILSPTRRGRGTFRRRQGEADVTAVVAAGTARRGHTKDGVSLALAAPTRA